MCPWRALMGCPYAQDTVEGDDIYVPLGCPYAQDTVEGDDIYVPLGFSYTQVKLKEVPMVTESVSVTFSF